MLGNIPTSAIITDLDPLIITAPATRSGTTLLQRLLCSSRRALIYGELVAQDLEFFLNAYSYKAQEYGYYRQRFTRNLEQILADDVNDWIFDLLPDLDGYVGALGRSAFAGLRYCRDYAQQLGRPVWGCKYPAWKPAFIRLLRVLMPRARFIAITRDLGPCVRSAKAQFHFNSQADVSEFCRTWLEGMEYWNRIGDDPAALVLRYEELTAEPDAALRCLAEFTRLDDIKREVLSRKINTWKGDHGLLEARDGYAPPAQLDEAEQQMVDQTLAAWRERTI